MGAKSSDHGGDTVLWDMQSELDLEDTGHSYARSTDLWRPFKIFGFTRCQNSSKSRVSKNAMAIVTFPSFIQKYQV
jgi:hypothetical protein